MKRITLLAVMMLFVNIAMAQTKFFGAWYDIALTDADVDNASNRLDIKKDTSSFAVAINQLGLICKNRFHGDTLLLYVLKKDCGRLFYEDYKPPKQNSLFAKCYIRDSKLHIIYCQKIFRENIDDFGLSTILYKH